MDILRRIFGQGGGDAPAAVPAPQPRPRRGCDPREPRCAAGAWAARIAGDPGALYLDTETTGLGNGDEVVEIAVVDNAGAVRWQTLLRPQAAIPAGAMAVHGIDDRMVAGAPTLADVADDLHRLLSGRTVVVYNAEYDRRLIGQSCARHGVAAPACGWECAMLQYARFAGEWNPRRNDYRWHKLDQAARAFGQRPGGHRAAADALACRHVVHGMAEWWDAQA